MGGARTFKIALSHCCKSVCKEDKGRPREGHTLWATRLTSDLARCCSNLWGSLSSFPAGLISSVLGLCCVPCAVWSRTLYIQFPLHGTVFFLSPPVQDQGGSRFSKDSGLQQGTCFHLRAP